MSVQTFLQRLAGRAAARQKTVAERWQAAVAAIADGKAPGEGDAEKLLAEAGKTPQDLAAAVDLLTRRRTACLAVDRGRTVQAEREKTGAALKAADCAYHDAVEAAQKKLAAVLQPLQDRQRELDRLDKEAAAAEKLLRETAADNPAMTTELADLREQLADAVKRQGAAQHAAHTAMTKAHEAAAIVNHQNWATSYTAEEKKAASIAHDDQAAEELKQRAQAAAVAAERAELEARIAVLQDAALVP